MVDTGCLSRSIVDQQLAMCVLG